MNFSVAFSGVTDHGSREKERGMSYARMLTAIVLTGVIVSRAVAGTPDECVARRVALATVNALILEGDREYALQFFHPDAQIKGRENGSAVESLRKQNPEMFRLLRIDEIIFFRADDVAGLDKRYPDDMWKDTRVGGQMDAALGCLVVLSVPERSGHGLLVLVIEERDGKQQIVYTDDN
jgi:hypothetical protein